MGDHVPAFLGRVEHGMAPLGDLRVAHGPKVVFERTIKQLAG
jgi:hypothetical protein